MSLKDLVALQLDLSSGLPNACTDERSVIVQGQILS